MRIMNWGGLILIFTQLKDRESKRRNGQHGQWLGQKLNETGMLSLGPAIKGMPVTFEGKFLSNAGPEASELEEVLADGTG